MRSFPYTPRAGFSKRFRLHSFGEFFLHSPCCNILVYLGSFSCTLHASSCGQFVLHVLCCFTWGVSLTHPVLFPVGSFTDSLDAVLCGEFLLHIVRIRLWVNELTCNNYRYNLNARQRLCPVWQSAEEDEIHFIFAC